MSASYRSEPSRPEFELLPFLRSPGGALIIATCICVGGCFVMNPYGIHEIAEFDCGKNRSIVLLMDSECDESRDIYYEVRIDGKTTVPMADCGDPTCNYSERFLDIRFAADGDVVGIIDVKYIPNSYWVVHDFRDGASWPRGDDESNFRGSGKFTREQLEELLRAEDASQRRKK